MKSIIVAVSFAALFVSAGANAQVRGGFSRGPIQGVCPSCVPQKPPSWYGGGSLSDSSQNYRDNLGRPCSGRVCRR